MKVKDLIAILQAYPPAARVVVEGYEGGFDDIKGVKEQPIVVNGNLVPRSGPWIGPDFVPAEYGMGPHAAPEGQPGDTELACVIQGYRK
jgi:hypothetical protein